MSRYAISTCYASWAQMPVIHARQSLLLASRIHQQKPESTTDERRERHPGSVARFSADTPCHRLTEPLGNAVHASPSPALCTIVQAADVSVHEQAAAVEALTEVQTCQPVFFTSNSRLANAPIAQMDVSRATFLLTPLRGRSSYDPRLQLLHMIWREDSQPRCCCHDKIIACHQKAFCWQDKQMM